MPAGPELIIIEPGQYERRVPLQGPFTVGRGTGNDLVIMDARASRSHVLFRPYGRGNYYLLDLGSANGTFLNGKLVTAPVELKDGDAVEVAGWTIRFASAVGAAGTGLDPTLDAAMTTAVNVTTEAISILVADIRGFTRISETLPPKKLPGLIGGWFRDAGAVIERRGGVIDKFIGDAVMAYWLGGGEGYDARLVRGPLDAAFELLELSVKYDQMLSEASPGLNFRIGCGIHTGEAMFGNLGGGGRRDFTAIGDCVNIAFRLEDLTKELGRPVIVSEAVKTAAGEGYSFEDQGPQILKGKAKEFQVFAASRVARPG